VLIRSWNLFHGNACPPQRRSHLEEMVRLATADGPAVLLLQEVPVWALGRLDAWSGSISVADTAQRPRLGPVPIPAELGRMLTSLHPGVLRSAFTGQGNAILLGRGLRPAARKVLALNPPAFRRETARRLRLDAVTRLAWAKERRICQAVRVERPGSPSLVVANLHATSFPADPRIPTAEVARALPWIDSIARDGDVVVAGGDFNLDRRSLTLPDGYSEPGPWIDHVLVRGARPSALHVWPDARRRRDGIVLSDHAPIELEIP
jgi:endonuclease/exonuclease/phosphatase family metal-dependent hydrolase